MSDPVDLKPGSITSIRAQARSPERVSVYLDDAFAFGIHRDILLEFDIRKGAELDVETQTRILRRDSFFRARSAAFRLLAYRNRTCAEISRKLERSEYPAEIAAAVVDHLKVIGLVDDTRYAANYAEVRFRSGGYGPARIRSDLQRKGIGRVEAAAAVAEVFNSQEEILDKARDLARKRWERLKREPDDRKRNKKLYDYLARRGYPFDVIHRIVEEISRNRKTNL